MVVVDGVAVLGRNMVAVAAGGGEVVAVGSMIVDR